MRIDFRTAQRGYTLVLSQDLFGAYVLYRRWFGLANRRGGTKQQIFVAEEKAMREVGRISRARIRNGYELVPQRTARHKAAAGIKIILAIKLLLDNSHY